MGDRLARARFKETAATLVHSLYTKLATEGSAYRTYHQGLTLLIPIV